MARDHNNRSGPWNFCTQDCIYARTLGTETGIRPDSSRLTQVTRSEDATRPKRVYLVAPSVRELLQADRRGQLKVMAAGVKTFERQDSKVATRAGCKQLSIRRSTKHNRLHRIFVMSPANALAHRVPLEQAEAYPLVCSKQRDADSPRNVDLNPVRSAMQDGSIPCNYRIVQEGLAALLPLMSAQTFRPTVDEFERIVTERSVPVPAPAPSTAAAAPGAVAETTIYNLQPLG